MRRRRCPTPAKVAPQANGDKCKFAAGGFLGGFRYPQSLHVTVGNDLWILDWTYTVAPDPAKPSPVPALTAWDLVSSVGGGTTAQVTLGATIASESVVVSSQFPSGKYSFSLAGTLSPGGLDQTTNRVAGLAWTIKDASNNVVSGFPQAVGSTVIDNKPGSAPYGGPPALDFTYTANVGTFGNATSALMDSNNSATATGTSPSDHVLGDARSILNGGLQNGAYHDTFKGNDNGGADGSALSDAVAGGVTANLGPGTYTVTLTGTVKDKATSYAQPVNVSGIRHRCHPGLPRAVIIGGPGGKVFGS